MRIPKAARLSIVLTIVVFTLFKAFKNKKNMYRQFRLTLILALVVLFAGGCKKWFEDDELTLSKKPYSGNELRIDGYYYLMHPACNGFSDTYFLYRDGTALSCGAWVEDSLFDSYEENIRNVISHQYHQNHKTGWGVFHIEGDSIAIERWWFASEQPRLPVYLLKGVILNDTTFHITYSTEPRTGHFSEKDEVYHFHTFSPKPDSTNIFIH